MTLPYCAQCERCNHWIHPMHSLPEVYRCNTNGNVIDDNQCDGFELTNDPVEAVTPLPITLNPPIIIDLPEYKGNKLVFLTKGVKRVNIESFTNQINDCLKPENTWMMIPSEFIVGILVLHDNTLTKVWPEPDTINKIIR